MASLFTPAVALMDRMKFPQKFMVLGATVVVSIAVLLYSLVGMMMESITFSKAELEGLKAIRPLMSMVQAAQQHRGLSASVIGGAKDMEEKRRAKGAELGKLMDEFPALLGKELRENPDWKKAVSAWREISAQVSGWDGATSFNRHTEFIDDLLDTNTAIADAYGLMLDPEVNSYYLMDIGVLKFPALLERLGRMRAKGAAALGRKEIAPQGRVELGIVEAETKTLLAETEKSVRKVVQASPALEASIAGAFVGMRDTAAAVVAVVNQDIQSGAFTTPPARFFEMVTQAIDAGYRQLYEGVYPALAKAIDARIDRATRSMALHMMVVAVTLCLLVYLSVGAYLAITRNLDVMSGAASRIAAGDLTARVELQCTDELGDTGNDFNRIATAMGDLLRDVQSSMARLLAAASQLSESARRIAESSEEQSNSATSMAAAVEETTTSISHISHSAQDAAQISSQAGDLSARGSDTVLALAGEMKAIAEVVNGSAANIQELGEQSGQISTIVAAIRAIADQTNLLALNAAIEAARAGESGRGFAVVADEVRKLAERTSAATQEIGSMVEAIQQGTARAVDGMRNGVERVGSGVEHAEHAGGSMNEIREGARHVVDMVADISSSLREQSAAAADMARNVEQIAGMAERNSHMASGNSVTARDLEQLATRVQAQIARFKLA